MAIASLIKCSLHGTVGTPGQTWSIGFWFDGGSTPPSLAGLQTFSDGILIEAAAWVADAKRQWGPLTTFNGVRTYYYPTLPGPAAIIATSDPDLPTAGTATMTMPGDVALVYSLRTGVAGRSNRGRVYLPFTAGGGLADSGQLVSTTVQNYANQGAGFITRANTRAATAGYGVCVVVSQTHSVTRPVTQVLVDSKLDVQRRRQDKNVAAAVGVGTV